MIEWIEAHPGLAAWVQAIGTVAAIVFATLLPQFERSRAERAAELALRPIAARGFERVYKTLCHLQSQSTTHSAEADILNLLRASEQEFINFPLHTLRPKMAVSVQEAQGSLYMLRRSFEDGERDIHTFLHWRLEFMKHMKAAFEASRLLWSREQAASFTQSMETAESELAAICRE